MEEKERFEIEHENSMQFECRLKLQGMSDLCMRDFVDIAWDEFCQSDDHIVPDPSNKRLKDHFILGDSYKKRHCELASISSNTGDRSAAARYADHGRDESEISPLSKRRNMMLEKDSWSHNPDNTFLCASDSDPVKEASSLACDNTMPSAHGLKRNNRNSNSSELCGFDAILDDKTSIIDNNSFVYPMGDINHTSNDINYFETAENKDSNDLLYSDWPEIENFEDIDRMFRSCDSTFGLGVCREDELGWLSLDDIGGSGDALNSDVKFPCPGPSEVENISENHDFSDCYSINNSAMISAPIRYKDSSWTSENSYGSSVIGPDIADSKDGSIPQGQVNGPGFNDKIQPRIPSNSHFRLGSAATTNKHKSQIKQEKQSDGKSEKHCPHVSSLSNEVRKLSSGLTSHQALQYVHMQQQQHASAPDSYRYSQSPISFMHSDNSHLSDPSSVNPKPDTVKSETNDLTSVSPRESSHASCQLQQVEGSPDPDFEATALAKREQRKMPHCCQGSLSSVHDSLADGSMTVQPSISDPGWGGKYRNHCSAGGASLATPAELGSSNMRENSTMGSDLDDISLEAASFRQLQFVMERLDLRTKLCIRDSLYRLAQSAEQRHNHANLNTGCGEGDTGTKRYTGFLDMETDTNPIDRSVAHLLFHRPSDSSTLPANESFPFKSSSAVHGSVASPLSLTDNLVSEENVSEVGKVSNC